MKPNVDLVGAGDELLGGAGNSFEVPVKAYTNTGVRVSDLGANGGWSIAWGLCEQYIDTMQLVH